MSSLSQGPIFNPYRQASGTFLRNPPVDVFQTSDFVQIEMDAPGLDPKEINISLESDELTIRGERKRATREYEQFLHTIEERNFGHFTRRFLVPTSIDRDRIEASYKDGVLSILLHRREDSKARQIAVATPGA